MRGYIRKRGKSYRVEIHIGYGPDGTRLRHSETLSTKKAAEVYLRNALEQLETEGTIRTRNVETLEAYLKRWLDVAAKPRLRQRTFENYTESLERHIFGTPLGRTPLATVGPSDIQGHYGLILAQIAASGRGTGATSIKNLHAVLRSALNQAVKWREIPQNPAVFVDLPRVQRREKRVLKSDEFPIFIKAALEEERNGVLWICALASGARPEEYLAWQWADVEWRACEITTVRALVRPLKRREGEPAWRFEPVKTDRGRRVIALDEEVMLLLRRHQAQQAEEKLAAGAAYEDLGLIFCNELGGPLHLHNLSQRVFKRIIERAGLNPELTPYSLRHSCATGLLALGEDIGQVSNMLGHASSFFTFDTYVARRPLRGAAGKMGRALFGDPSDEKRKDDGV